ncbi:DUF192 domain-containing protein [Candidatus Woesearchaeota archaeon]|nr:DUF192 domain-containing protein [Candidatus Woesearchaeota archaeon]
MKKYIFLIILLIFITGCKEPETITKEITITTNETSIKINAEIADTHAKRAKGLQDRESLEENTGMLFIFERPDIASFWMKDTLIPLDMIFISENYIGEKTITKIESAEPCTTEKCPAYSSEKAVKYVLEVNAGFAERNGIEVGNRISWE